MSAANPGATPSAERRQPGQRGDPDGAAQVLRAPADAGDRNAAAALSDADFAPGAGGWRGSSAMLSTPRSARPAGRIPPLPDSRRSGGYSFVTGTNGDHLG